MQVRHDMRRTSNRRGFTHRRHRGQRIAQTTAGAGDRRSADLMAACTSR
ncbi:hypothetical protein [Micromonospora sp. KC721]|nr:hypothetical protein [Micromonospora sp. KC721]